MSPSSYLHDGSIDAHKMILAAVSPVFERMFYGDFKEGNAKFLVNFGKLWYWYSWVCFTNDCSLWLFTKSTRSHYNTCVMKPSFHRWIFPLLPKYVSVMSEEDHKKVADKVMSYTNFVTKFDVWRLDDQTKDLCEEVMLPLMNSYSTTQAEINVFKF